MPAWPQPQGIFTDGIYFNPVGFLTTLREVYEKVVIDKVSGEAAMEHEAFARLLFARTLTQMTPRRLHMFISFSP